MPNISTEIRIIFWVLAAFGGALFAIFIGELGKNIIYFFSLRRGGRPPTQRPIYVWLLCFIGLALSIVFGALAAYTPSSTQNEIEYTGRVIDPISQQPIAGAKITLDLQGVSPIVYTDSEGVYQFKVAIESNISVQITIDAQGYQVYTRNITISPNLQTIEDIRLVSLQISPTPGETEYIGHVIDPGTLRPIANAKVTLTLEGVPLIVYTNSEGAYRFKVTNESSIGSQIRVEAPGYQVYTRNITISPNLQTIEDIRLVSLQISPTPIETGVITPTPNLTQTLQAVFAEIDKQFQNEIKSNIAFNKPTQMKRGATASIELLLSPSLSESALATQLVNQGGFVTSTSDPTVLIGPHGETVTVDTSQIEITPRMKAVLSPQDSTAFTVQAMHDNAEQVVSSAKITTWRWSVMASKEGSQTLELIVSQLVRYDGKEFWHEVETYKANIVVEVTVTDRLRSLDWKWIAGFILAFVGSVLGVLTWLNNRNKEQKEDKSKEYKPVKNTKKAGK